MTEAKPDNLSPCMFSEGAEAPFPSGHGHFPSFAQEPGLRFYSLV